MALSSLASASNDPVTTLRTDLAAFIQDLHSMPTIDAASRSITLVGRLDLDAILQVLQGDGGGPSESWDVQAARR